MDIDEILEAPESECPIEAAAQRFCGAFARQYLDRHGLGRGKLYEVVLEDVLFDRRREDVRHVVILKPKGSRNGHAITVMRTESIFDPTAAPEIRVIETARRLGVSKEYLETWMREAKMLVGDLRKLPF